MKTISSTADACPVPGCQVEVETSKLMCRKHWYMVSQGTRNRVWNAWRGVLRGQEGAVEKHRAAKAMAIREVGDKQANA